MSSVALVLCGELVRELLSASQNPVWTVGPDTLASCELKGTSVETIRLHMLL